MEYVDISSRSDAEVAVFGPAPQGLPVKGNRGLGEFVHAA